MQLQPRLTRSYTLTITQLVVVITFVISQGNEVLIGYDKGAGDNNRALSRGNRTAFVTAAVTALFTAVLYLNSYFFAGLFTDKPDVVEGVRELLFLSIFSAPC